MERSPDRLNLEHLKKQAKDLIRLYRQHDREAFIRFRRALPAAAGRSDDEVASLNLRLHDAQSCVARDYGFASWQDFAAIYRGAAAYQRGEPESRAPLAATGLFRRR